LKIKIRTFAKISFALLTLVNFINFRWKLKINEKRGYMKINSGRNKEESTLIK
jgi:hypothetical protein